MSRNAFKTVILKCRNTKSRQASYDALTTTEHGRDLMIAIHTIDARGNGFLDVAFENPRDNSEEIRRQITSALNATIKQLADHGVKYKNLRTALTPQVDKKELALIFDSELMSGWYGGEAAETILPHLERRSNHSILAGDLIYHDIDTLLSTLNVEGKFWRQTSISASQQLYVVYITNLTVNAANRLIERVRSSRGSIGYVDCSYSGFMKTVLSMCLVTQYVKTETVFVSTHPFDADEDASENAGGWRLNEHGYTYCSIADLYFDLFLRYKIESLHPSWSFNDGHFSLAAITGIWKDPRNLSLTVHPDKREYLRRNKGGSLEKAGLTGLSAEDLAFTIKNKIAANYIYNLTWNQRDGYSNFATMIEFSHSGRRIRLRAVLKFEHGKLGLVSLFG